MSSADDRDSASSAAPTTAEKIKVLCRIFRAAVKSGDAELRATTSRELAEYGVQLGDLIETNSTVSSAATECSSCRFWDLDTNRNPDDVGICRRYPPTIPNAQSSVDDYQDYPVWPLTLDSEWCGEHKPKKGNSDE